MKSKSAEKHRARQQLAELKVQAARMESRLSTWKPGTPAATALEKLLRRAQSEIAKGLGSAHAES